MAAPYETAISIARMAGELAGELESGLVMDEGAVEDLKRIEDDLDSLYYEYIG